MLETLTSEQISQFPTFVDYGLKMGLSTERSDRVKAEQALLSHYESCGLEKPRVEWFDSPYAILWASVGASVWASVRASVGASVGTSVRASVGTSVWASVRASVGTSVRASVGTSVWASVRASVGAFYDADDISVWLAWDTYGISLPKTAYTYMKVCEEVWYFVPTKDVVYVSDRPTHILKDEQNRLHCESGKAVLFQDGKGVSSWHGQTIPDEWVAGHKPTPQEALTWENVEQRRAACEILGWSTVLDQLHAKIIDEDHDPLIGSLLEVDLPDIGKEKFLDVRCGTGRRFALPCPPDMNTALEAQAWINWSTPEEIRAISVRT